jgi:putative FmdB family regulatory protein
MFLQPFYTKSDNHFSVSGEQGSHFAKQICNDYNPIHDPEEFELIQKFSDKPKTKCPNCEQDTLSKLVSAPSFRLKGGGWYETDFKTGKKKNLVSNDKESANKSIQNAPTDSKNVTKQDKISK